MGLGVLRGRVTVVSYTLSQDALRFGAFAGGKGEGGGGCVVEEYYEGFGGYAWVSEVVLWGMKVDHKVYNWFGSEYSGR